ncbi:succinate dehydrogenase assembly factor 2-B, mitochondrial-like isoform X1 [Bolinopsis microptera]|uniref:succinate dehydrogenase assembly factor 2-B, mitochondrial-like isoform X1 n=1 Tax=Bolinopsis microptera TaxID=2820187 RepID=UPI00307ACFD9
MLRSLVGRIAPKCSSSISQAVKIRALSSGDKKTRDVTTMFGDIVVECEPHRDDTEFTVPSYPARINEAEESLRARLIWQSRKRGIAENCLILSTFFSEHGPSLPRKIVEQFDILINTVDSDWDLYYWMTGKEQPPPPYDNEVMKMLIEFTQNKEMKDRTQQPELK